MNVTLTKEDVHRFVPTLLVTLPAVVTVDTQLMDWPVMVGHYMHSYVCLLLCCVQILMSVLVAMEDVLKCVLILLVVVPVVVTADFVLQMTI